MITSLAKMMFASAVRSKGKQMMRDNTAGSKSYVRGRVFSIVADAIDAIDLTTLSSQTFRNMGEAFQAVADECKEQADSI